ncbi:GDSL lipase-like [Euphorbia lathyris]|uniref:GDSL lipase-like n=1 Tax=Euphorbia lathyris TaxID=212925 RepID=UPI0033135FE4
MANPKSLLGFLLISVSLLVLVKSRKHVAMFVFGDSLYDPGNNNNLNVSIIHKADYWPYGETFFHYATGRFCDGRLIPDFIATYAELPIWKPYLDADADLNNFTNGANFAAGGAGALPQTDAGSVNLTQQLSFFKEVANKLRVEVGEVEAKEMLMEAIYLNSIGGDDYADILQNYPNITQSQKQYFVKMVIDILIHVIKEIYEMGGRKFVFQNVGPMGCLPISKQENELSSEECDEQLQSIVQLHNIELPKAVEALETQLQGFEYALFDYYTSLYDIIQNPSNYGLRVADVACCGNGTNRATDCGIEAYELCSNASEYVFFDGSHPGDATNLLLAQLLWNGNSTTVIPRNLKDLYDLQITTNNGSDHLVAFI